MPEKALALVAGLPLLEHVRRRAVQADVGPVYVATDDDKIAAVIREHGGRVVRTGSHPNGTLRVAEAAEQVGSERVINVQGDQPLLDPSHVVKVAQALDHGDLSTLATRWPTDVSVDDPHSVKVWADEQDCAIDFDRTCIRPDPRLHQGLYGFTRERLRWVTSCPISERAQTVRLEQLSWLEAGAAIRVVTVGTAAPAVDSAEQLTRVRQILE